MKIKSLILAIILAIPFHFMTTQDAIAVDCAKLEKSISQLMLAGSRRAKSYYRSADRQRDMKKKSEIKRKAREAKGRAYTAAAGRITSAKKSCPDVYAHFAVKLKDFLDSPNCRYSNMQLEKLFDTVAMAKQSCAASYNVISHKKPQYRGLLPH
uniref:Uncharacterized protein n=1 Tax=Magnetococcus massalia (strain MO-1) TaxID=451514 RepID=A0A1S7LLE0_MAGMO|nr:Exported protein of unknown function [Candidatus Magnetococcus massalia]